MKKQARLQLSEYSNKYKVSVSTLRRRIKAEEIEYEFEDGKYWLADQPIEKYVRNRSTPPKAAPMKKTKTPVEEKRAQNIEVPIAGGQFVTREEVLDLTHNMLNELKAAYVLVLQEKEEQILEAKREVADLKTLCHLLETENEKLKAGPEAPLTGWFTDEVDIEA